MHSTTQLGMQGEQLVADYLVQQGFTILEHNYKKKYGEIDLIAAKNKLVVFVEVKVRRADYFDSSELITYAKRKRIINVAYEYLDRHERMYRDGECRFDVALVAYAANKPQITYLPNAFEEC